LIEDYFRQVDALITGTSIVHSFSVTYDKRSTYIGFIRGSVYFLDGSVLHFREFVNVQHGVERYIYAFTTNVPTPFSSSAMTTHRTSPPCLPSLTINMLGVSQMLCRLVRLTSRRFWLKFRT
jgi:hypothetical protein